MTDKATPDRHPRGSSWCAEVGLHGRQPDDPRYCWCGYEIIYETGQCEECQADARDEC